MDAGILPVKRLDAAKGRLAPHLPAEARREVAKALLEDALDLCGSTPLAWFVVSDDEDVLRDATGRGLSAVREPGGGLNRALATGVERALAAGATAAAMVPSDLPLATPEDIADLLDTGAASDVVVVPAEDGGTSGLYLSPPDLMAPRFGGASLSAHVAGAEALGVRCSLLPLERMALDLDTIEDVETFLRAPARPGSRTYRLLADLRSGPS